VARILCCGLVALCSFACSRTGLETAARSDGGGVDAGPTDASRPDAGRPDAGPRDSGVPCARDAELRFETSTPNTVVLVLDGSSSMLARFGALTRWDAVRTALTGPDGAVRTLDDRVPFAAVRYSGTIECPGLETVEARLDSADTIDALLATFVGGSTPTAETLAAVRADVDALTDGFDGGVAFVLATDGEPVPCDGRPTDDSVRAAVVEQVAGAFDDGISTFVLSVGADLSEAHLQDLANAGAGVRRGEPDVPAWRADDPTALTELLAVAIDAAIACTTQLPWEVADGCDAAVELDGEPLECRGADGFRVEGARLLFSGAACEAWEAGATARIRAPCE